LLIVRSDDTEYVFAYFPTFKEFRTTGAFFLSVRAFTTILVIVIVIKVPTFRIEGATFTTFLFGMGTSFFVLVLVLIIHNREVIRLGDLAILGN
jgi:hypothetical protein